LPPAAPDNKRATAPEIAHTAAPKMTPVSVRETGHAAAPELVPIAVSPQALSEEDRFLLAREELLARLTAELSPERISILSRGELAKVVDAAVQRPFCAQRGRSGPYHPPRPDHRIDQGSSRPRQSFGHRR